MAKKASVSKSKKHAPKAAAPAAPAPSSAAPKPVRSAEGVPVEYLDTETIVNRSTDSYDARRRELHIGGRTFAHVSDAADGAWIYRHDK